MRDDKEVNGPIVLAIETSSAVGSVALGRGSAILEARTFARARAHAVEFFPTLEELCRRHGMTPAKIDTLIVSRGPGSFTGLRVGITAARILAFATRARVVAVPTLEIIAQNALAMDRCFEELAVLLDAKRGRVYAASFRMKSFDSHGSLLAESVQGVAGRYEATSEPAEVDPSEFLAGIGRTCAVLGEGVLYHRRAVDASGLTVLAESFYRPRAEILYRLGIEQSRGAGFVEARGLIPTYIRPPEAEEKWQQRQRQSPR